MTITAWSLIISILAILIAIWGRIEAFYDLRKKSKIDFAKRIGEALVASQKFKNILSDNISLYENLSEEQIIDGIKKLHQIKAIPEENKGKFIEDFKEKLNSLKNEYLKIWEVIQLLEKTIVQIKMGNHVSINSSAMEANIAHLNQKITLAEFDLKYLEKFL